MLLSNLEIFVDIASDEERRQMLTDQDVATPLLKVDGLSPSQHPQHPHENDRALPQPSPEDDHMQVAGASDYADEEITVTPSSKCKGKGRASLHSSIGSPEPDCHEFESLDDEPDKYVWSTDEGASIAVFDPILRKFVSMNESQWQPGFNGKIPLSLLWPVSFTQFNV